MYMWKRRWESIVPGTAGSRNEILCHLEPVWSETFQTISNGSTFRTADTARRPEQLLTRGFLRPFYAGHHYPSSPALRDHPFHHLQR